MPSNDDVTTTLYLAGPMRGKPLYNFQEFENAKCSLATSTVRVISPHDMDIADGSVTIAHRLMVGPYGYGREFHAVEWNGEFAPTMRKDIAEIVTKCDGIVLLPGWEDSEGARLEQTVAVICGLDVYEWHNGTAVLIEDPEPSLQPALKLMEAEAKAL